jgi:hypothetical protein
LPPFAFLLFQNCLIFDNEDENKLVYTEVHQKFLKLVEDLLSKNLHSIGVCLSLCLCALLFFFVTLLCFFVWCCCVYSPTLLLPPHHHRFLTSNSFKPVRRVSTTKCTNCCLDKSWLSMISSVCLRLFFLFLLPVLCCGLCFALCSFYFLFRFVVLTSFSFCLSPQPLRR